MGAEYGLRYGHLLSARPQLMLILPAREGRFAFKI